MKTKISIIIPIYNAKEYLDDCIASVFEQTCTDYELLLIDDGSQDGSRDICNKLAVQYKRIRVICQKHKGVSAARNAGIEAACGKYLFFLDSDDVIHPQLLEALYELQEENHTVIAATELYCGRKGEVQRPDDWKIEKKQMWVGKYFDNSEAVKSFSFHNMKAMFGAIGGKMILHEAVKTLRFDEDLACGEDTWFLCQVIFAGANIIVLPRRWYYYRNSREKGYSVDSCTSIYKCQRAVCDHATKNNKAKEAVHAEWCLLCRMVVWKEMGKRNQDVKLQEYVKKIIEDEKKRELYSKVDWCRKMIFYLGCVCYPLYKWIADFMYWYHTSIESR